eukprot:2024757-Amphidinium_carterae.1
MRICQAHEVKQLRTQMRLIPLLSACSQTSDEDLTQGRRWAVCVQLSGHANICIDCCIAYIKTSCLLGPTKTKEIDHLMPNYA